VRRCDQRDLRRGRTGQAARGQADGRILAQGGDAFQGHAAAALDPPLVLLEQQGADEAPDCCLVEEDADHLGAPLDLDVEAFKRIGGMDLGPVFLRETYVSGM